MVRKSFMRSLAIAAVALAASASPAAAQTASISIADDMQAAGELAVPVNKSQVLRVDRPYAKALIGNPEVADVLPLTNQSVYLLGKKAGTTSLTLYDSRNMLIAVVDVVVGPDVITLRRQLSETIPGSEIGARISNDAIVLEGIVPNGPTADRAVQLAETYAPGKVVNMMAIGSSQQVMLEVRFSELTRGASKAIGINHSFLSDSGKFVGGVGDSGILGVPVSTSTSSTNGGAFNNVTETIKNGVSETVQTIGTTSGSSSSSGTSRVGNGALDLLLPTAGFGAIGLLTKIGGLSISSTLDALEQKGMASTLAEPNLIALSGETASFLAGGEFPVPVAQSSSGTNTGISAVTVEFKPFGVGLSFTPTVLADGVINLVVQPEVSSLDSSAAVIINGFRVPGLRTRRAKTTVELRDGESFAIAGLLRKDFEDTIRQVPVLGTLPIIGALFRSTNFQKGETELVIIVTPRLVRPVRAGTLRSPTDRAGPPNEADLFLGGRTDTGVPLPAPFNRNVPAVVPAPVAPAAGGGGMAKAAPVGFEKDYGHVL